MEALLPEDTIIHPELADLNYPANNQGTKQWLAADSGFSDPRFMRRLNEAPGFELIVANVGIHNMRVDGNGTWGTTPELYGQHLNQIFDTLTAANVPIV